MLDRAWEKCEVDSIEQRDKGDSVEQRGEPEGIESVQGSVAKKVGDAVEGAGDKWKKPDFVFTDFAMI